MGAGAGWGCRHMREHQKKWGDIHHPIHDLTEKRDQKIDQTHPVGFGRPVDPAPRDLLPCGQAKREAGMRPDGRSADQLREVRIVTGVQRDPHGSVQVTFGNTIVLCAATVSERVPENVRLELLALARRAVLGHVPESDFRSFGEALLGYRLAQSLSRSGHDHHAVLQFHLYPTFQT